ncbi:hypothetical protein [Virgibacillus sp. L01]|uniref:hypothetical protein n=1 Tax=Virgibacillus sp. L01 TaxID=3457429 RepID=UPI003FD3A5DA
MKSKRSVLIIMSLIIIVLSVLSFSLYQKNEEVKSEVLKKELLIFKNHITGTVRAVDARDKALLDDTLLRISTFETFHSQYLDNVGFTRITVDAYEQGLKYLLDADTSNYSKIRDDLDSIFQTITSYNGEEIDQEKFKKIIDGELFPQVKAFRDNAEKLSEEG